tara:strand:+ start:252 stop:1079 length:828 start_codon:yes stop_codon:yes gene_type:complete
MVTRDYLCKLIHNGINGRHIDAVKRNRKLLPDFIIIGSAKSATTTLSTILKKHPDVFISKPKEPKFFGRCYYKGWDWYGSRFRKANKSAIKGEASTMYTSGLGYFRYSAKLMNRYLPDLKLIYLVRHPMNRIISQWRHYRGRNPNCPEFNELMQDDHMRNLIIGCSMYYEQITRYRQYYPDSQIHCLTFEDFIKQPRRNLKLILKFLGVKKPMLSMILDANGKLPKENQAGEKGRGHVEKPVWNPNLHNSVLNLLRADSIKFLNYIGKPCDFWDF